MELANKIDIKASATTVGIYSLFGLVCSRRPKSECLDFGQNRFGSVPKSFRFRPFGLSTGTKPNVRFSDDPLN